MARRTVGWMHFTRRALALTLAFVFATPAQFKPGETVAQHRQTRAEFLRGELSPLALIHREYLASKPRWVIGSSASADIKLAGAEVAPEHAVIEVAQNSATVQFRVGAAPQQDLRAHPRFRIGSYVLNFRPGGLAQGAALDVYDLQAAARVKFSALDYFPESADFRVAAQLTPMPTPQKINLVDSAGFHRPYWIYGHLVFRVKGSDMRMEVYTATLDWKEIERDGFMLIFADQTSGKETYSAGRYLYIAGMKSGAVEIDFNKAYNPPCAFSAVFTCPFPRKENRVRVAIRAGERTYRGLTTKPI